MSREIKFGVIDTQPNGIFIRLVGRSYFFDLKIKKGATNYQMTEFPEFTDKHGALTQLLAIHKGNKEVAAIIQAELDKIASKADKSKAKAIRKATREKGAVEKFTKALTKDLEPEVLTADQVAALVEIPAEQEAAF